VIPDRRASFTRLVALRLRRPVGSEIPWFENVLKTPRIRLAAHDVAIGGVARPITDPQRVREVVDTFRAKYGAEEVKAVEVRLS
jgi:hypothetical protein